MSEEIKNVMLQPEIESKRVTNTLEMISEPLDQFVKFNGLPTENVLASNEEKTKLFNNFSSAIALLPTNERAKSDYLTKFVVASAVGLFDGALNFLWDEIIKNLREKIVNYDLIYFYSIVEQINSKYQKLNKIEDLQYISDYDLLCALKRIGLIDDMAFHTLENINYLRNNASAAHPNNIELTGLKLVSLLEDGIKYAILIEPNTSMITIRKLFNNIRVTEIPSDDYDIITEELLKREKDRLSDFAYSIFGLYCDLRSSEITQKNVIEISKRIWNDLTEEIKYTIGSTYGLYRKNGDVEQKDRVNQYLETVEGLKYRDMDSISAEIIDLLQQLRTAHFGINNFYNEYGYAANLEKIIPISGIPKSVRKLFVKTICLCYAGNGCGYRDGVDEYAEIIYEKFISKFENSEIREFIIAFSDVEFTIDFYKLKTDERVRKMCNKFLEQTTNSDLVSGLNVILNHPCRELANIEMISDYQAIIKKLTD